MKIQKKPWYNQRTTRVGILSILGGGVLCALGQVGVGAPMIVNGAMGIFGRQAINSIIDNVADVAGTVSNVAGTVSDVAKVVKDNK